MEGQVNPRIVGATIIGFALIAGAYTVSNFGKPRHVQQVAHALSAETPVRAPIAVTDNDQNGIEDWRDEFVTAKPVILDRDVAADYTPPTTVTGKMSIGLMEGFISSKGNGPFGASKDTVVQKTVNYLVSETDHKLYDTKDATIMTTWDDQDIVNYGNTLANILIQKSNRTLDGEMAMLYDVLNNQKPERVEDLKALEQVYLAYRDSTIQTPVPALFIKEHLDLVNTYQALYEDIHAMSLILEDPAVTLLHLKRYQDDVTGLGYALQNVYFALKKHEQLFTKNDPAILFVMYSPDVIQPIN